jgi:hypothetical protein
LCENEVCGGREVEQLSVDIEELLKESLDTMEVVFGLRVKPFEVDVENVEVLRVLTIIE